MLGLPLIVMLPHSKPPPRGACPICRKVRRDTHLNNAIFGGEPLFFAEILCVQFNKCSYWSRPIQDGFAHEPEEDFCENKPSPAYVGARPSRLIAFRIRSFFLPPLRKRFRGRSRLVRPHLADRRWVQQQRR